MSAALLASLREALQLSLLIFLIAGHRGAKGRLGLLALGVSAAFIAGFALSYLPSVGPLPGGESWSSMRHVSEVLFLYVGLFFAVSRAEPFRPLPGAMVFLLGFFVYFFEAGALGFFVRTSGALREAPAVALAVSVLGTLLGLAPLLLIGRSRPHIEKVLTLPGLLVALGGLKFAMGGVGEVDGANVFVSLEGGLQAFLENTVGHVQRALMLTPHEFLPSPFSGVARSLSGDSMATALAAAFALAPPVYVLIDVFSRPDPEMSDIEAASERRLRLASFRKGLAWHSLPALCSFVLVLVALHTATLAMNPLSEPDPMPVREDGSGRIVIPLSDRLGDLTDGRLRKYAYYYGDKGIVFLAIMKPDGAPGVALDECEVCRPAEWNKDAQGYAQRGENLICKYCMTPIAVSTVNEPGGCNPIPFAFRVEDGSIVIELDDLVRAWKEARKLEKKGMGL